MRFLFYFFSDAAKRPAIAKQHKIIIIYGTKNSTKQADLCKILLHFICFSDLFNFFVAFVLNFLYFL